MSTTSLHGVLSVLATPFADDGSLDLASLRRLVDVVVADGSAGVVTFGLAGELYKLNDYERAAVLDTVVDQVDSRVPVVAGTEHTSVEGSVWRSTDAVARGADAVMVYPPSFVKLDNDGIHDYFAAIADAIDVPVVVQDAPAWTGVALPLETLVAIHDRSPRVSYVKVENPPNAPKIRALCAAGFACIGGYGALHLPEDHDAGVSAVMPGCGLPATYVHLWDLLQRDPLAGWERHRELLPLLSFQMSSLDVFVAVQKGLLREAGVLASDRVRRPGRRLDADQTRWLHHLLTHTPLSEPLAARHS